MNITDTFIEGKNRPIIFPLSVIWGGGKIKLEINFNNDGILTKYSLAYINSRYCKRDNGRLIGIDSEHPGHPSDCPHIHRCGNTSNIRKDITLSDIMKMFVTLVGKIIMHIKNNSSSIKESLTEEAKTIIDQIPGFNQFLTSAESLIEKAEIGRLKAIEYYKNNPDAPFLD